MMKKDNSYFRMRAHRARKKVIEALGGKCVKCGFSDWRALQIDHINGGGHRELKILTRYKMYKLAAAFPKKYQLLCANCNWIKRYKNGEHKKWSEVSLIKKPLTQRNNYVKMGSMGKVTDKNKMVTTLYISKDIYKKIKVYAAKRLIPIGQVVEEAMTAFLEKPKE